MVLLSLHGFLLVVGVVGNDSKTGERGDNSFDESDASCIRTHETVHGLRRFDGAMATYNPMTHSVNDIGYLVAVAKQQLNACWIHGGRYWEVELDANSYIENGPTVARGVFCMPAICERDAVKQIASVRLGVLFAGDFNLSALLANATANELTQWDDLSLDFVIAGIDRCGTTSMRHALLQHPEISFTAGGLEDYGVFVQGQRNKLLPWRSHIDELNTRVHSGSQRPKILGLAHPGIFNHPLATHAIASTDKVKVIVVLCDPVGRLERIFLHDRACHDDIDEAVRRGLVPPGRLHNRDQSGCVGSMAKILSNKERSWINVMKLGDNLNTLLQALGPRLLLVHQDEMRLYPRSTYDGVVKDLGMSTPLPLEAKLEVHGSRSVYKGGPRGHRTDFCRTPSVLGALKHRLKDDYTIVETLMRGLGRSLPRSIINRTTRCDRPEDLLRFD